jgi:hypothetical protein
MTPSGSDYALELLRKAATVLETVKHSVGYGQHAVDKLAQVHDAANHLTHYVLLPLCVAFYWLYEHYDSLARGSGFPLGRAIARTAAFVVLIIGYGYVCHLITAIAGAGGSWMSSNDYFDQVSPDTALDALGDAWAALGSGVGDIAKFVVIVLVWVILTMAALFAFVASSILSFLQSVFLAFLVSLGKMALTVSIIPGVSLARGWATSLAKVAAWSTVCGVLIGMIHTDSANIHDLIVHAQVGALIRVAAHYVVVALLTIAVPILTNHVFSGAAPGLTEAAIGAFAAAGVIRQGVKASHWMRHETPARGRDAGKFAQDVAQGAQGTPTRKSLDNDDGPAPIKAPYHAPEPPPLRAPTRASALSPSEDDLTPIASPREELLKRCVSAPKAMRVAPPPPATPPTSDDEAPTTVRPTAKGTA